MLYSKDRQLLFQCEPGQEPEMKRLGATFVPKLNAWSLPPLCSSIAALKRSFGKSLQIDPSVGEAGYFTPFGFYAEATSEIGNKLFSYQREAVNFLLSSPHHGALLALSPGLGKTLVTIEAARLLKMNRILVVAPLSLLFNWQMEIKKWSNLEATNCHGSIPEGSGWHVTNFETVVRLKKEYLLQRFDLVIIDESIAVKNRNAARSKTMLAMSRLANKVWLLSGSPTARYADDLYTQFAILEPSYFKSYWRFAHEYCVSETTIWGEKITANRPNINFRDEFRDILFVRNQKDVLPDLPNMLFETINLEMESDQRAMYKTMAKEFILELESGDITAATKVAQLIRLQQIVSCPDVFVPGVKSCRMRALDTLLDTQTLPLPAIVWINFKQSAENLYKELVRNHPELEVQVITGDSVDRAAVFTAFQDGLVDVLILSIGVGKFGLTLHKAQSALYYDKTYDGDAYLQSLARIHRVGLDHSPLVVSLRVPGTTDELIELNLQGKMKSVNSISNNDLATLMKGLSKT